MAALLELAALEGEVAAWVEPAAAASLEPVFSSKTVEKESSIKYL